MSIEVKFFGQLAEATGVSHQKIEDILDTDSLENKISSDFPLLKKHSFVIAVNKQIVNENKSLKSGDEVALLPPFAGG